MIEKSVQLYQTEPVKLTTFISFVKEKCLLHTQAPTHQLLACVLSDYSAHLCHGSEGIKEIFVRMRNY